MTSSESLRDRLTETLGSELNCSYDCSRVWEAWSVGTMSQNDFSPVDDRLGDIVDSVMAVVEDGAAKTFGLPLSDADLTSLYEGSKYDALPVGSEVRQMVAEIKWHRAARAQANAAPELAEALRQAVKVIEMFKDPSTLAEGVHTGLRKGTDASDSTMLWNAIANSRTSAWGDAIRYAIDPYFSMWGGNKALKAAEKALADFDGVGDVSA